MTKARVETTPSSVAARAFALPEVWMLTAITAFLHFWRLFTPNAVIFDEVYFERFAGFYMNRGFVFDVHPPLGRILYGIEALLLGLSPTALVQGASTPELRVLPALFGVMIVPLAYFLLRQLRASRKVSTFAAAALVMENALLVDTRLVLTDVFLIVFGLVAINAYLAARSRSGPSRLRWLAVSALAGGCALSVKWTGASALGLISLTWLIEMKNSRPLRARWLRECALLVVIPAAVYLGSFYVYFARATHDGYRTLWMSDRFLRQLPGRGEYDPAAPKVGYFTTLIDMHRGMLRANHAIGADTNPQSSPWYTWPIMKHPISLWQGPEEAGGKGMMQLLGNPLIWWGGMLGVLIGVALFVLRRPMFKEYEFGFLFLLGGVAINYLPFIAISRMMFIYHYLYALIFVVVLASYVAGIALGWMSEPADAGPWAFPSRCSARVYFGVLGLLLVSFAYFTPFTYGFRQTDAAIDRRFWVLHPRL